MRDQLPPQSICRKITLMMVLITGLVLLLACVALFIIQSWSIRKNLATQAAVTAEMVAGSVAVATMFDDGDRAREILAGLRASPYVVAAELLRMDGTILADFARDETAGGNPVVQVHPVAKDDVPYGSLRLLSDFSGPRRKLMLLSGGILCGVLMASLLVTFMLSRRFQGLVTDPILRLAGTARKIGGGKDYAMRAEPGGQDETGVLTSAFNQMLDQIEEQDLALQTAQKELQHRLRELELEVADRKRAQTFQGQLIAMLDNTPDFVARATPAGRVLYLNPAGRRMVGLSSTAEFNGLGLSDFFPHWSLHLIRNEGMPTADREGSWHGETALKHCSGSEIPVSQVLICHRDAAGGVESYSTIMRDISERRAAEQALQDSQAQLLESSRLAGMAEVATSVLHNVGNVLNSVNVSGNLINDRLRTSKLAALEKIASLVAEHRSDFQGFIVRDPRGQRLPELVLAVTEALQAEHSGLLAEIGAISGNIGHIKEIVAMQQSYSRFGGLIERISADDLVEDAMQLYASSFARHGILVRQDCAITPPLLIDKHKVLQILVNLIANARHALMEGSVGEKCLTLRVRHEAVSGSVEFTVEDNGMGIAPDHLTRIFSHGFTTKKDGHGYGLHSSALAAREMNGSLRVHSNGPGTGSAFTLSLPVQPVESFSKPEAILT